MNPMTGEMIEVKRLEAVFRIKQFIIPDYLVVPSITPFTIAFEFMIFIQTATNKFQLVFCTFRC